MQKKTFPDTGGFALHKIKGNWSGQCSAWYRADGSLKDAEQITALGQVRPVKAMGPMEKQLRRMGGIYANAADNHPCFSG